MALTRAQMDALLKRLEKPVRDAFAIAILNAKSRAQINRLIAAIEDGNIDEIMLAAGIRYGMYSSFTESIRGAYAQSGVFILAVDVPKRLAMEFDINNPRAESWLRNNSSQLITGHLMPEQRAAIQVMLQNGMIKGFLSEEAAAKVVVSAIIPLFGWLVRLIVFGWQIAATVVAVRQALDYATTGKAVVVCILGAIAYAAVIFFLGALGLTGMGMRMGM